jgi:hypothetical protein
VILIYAELLEHLVSLNDEHAMMMDTMNELRLPLLLAPDEPPERHPFKSTVSSCI